MLIDGASYAVHDGVQASLQVLKRAAYAALQTACSVKSCRLHKGEGWPPEHSSSTRCPRPSDNFAPNLEQVSVPCLVQVQYVLNQA